MIDQFCRAKLWNSYLLQCLKSTLLAGWLGWLAYQTGKAILRISLPPNSLSRLEAIVFGCGLGFGFFSQSVLGAGLAGLWYRGVFWGGLICLTVGALLFRKPFPFSLPRQEGNRPQAWKPVWIILLGLFFVVLLLAGLTPEIFYDALHYHLGIPNLYRLAHRIYNLPDSLYANFVMAVEMLYGLAITISDEIAAKLLHGELAILLGVAMIAFGQRYLTETSGIVAALLFLSMPLVGLNVGTAGVDVAWSFFEFLGVFALIRSLDGPRRSWLRLAGVFTGLAADCKYPGFAFIPFGCLILLWEFRGNPAASTRAIAIDLCEFTWPAVLILLPNLTKNVFFHHNPIYPFFGTRWGIPKLPVNRWKDFIADPQSILWEGHLDARQTLRFLLHPWFITLEGSNRSNFVGPMYLIGLPLLVIIPAANSATRVLKRFGFLLWVFWMLTSKVPRYGLPALAMFAPALADGIFRISAPGAKRQGLMLLVLVGFLMNFQYVVKAYFMMQGWQVLAGLQSPKAYLGMSHHDYPYPPFEAIDWMDGHLPPSSKVLFVGDSRSFYSAVPAVANSVFDPQYLVEASRMSRDGSGLADALRKENITHIFLNLIEARRNDPYHFMAWDAKGWKAFSEFWSRDVQQVWKSQNDGAPDPKYLVVYRVLDEKEAAKPHSAPANPFALWAPQAPA